MHLNNKIFCLDLSSSTGYKEKKSLIDLITNNGAKVSFILNKNVSYLVKTDKTNLDSYKCRTAFKLGIPVIHVDFIRNCLDNNNYVNLKEYLILNQDNENCFKKGKIAKSTNQRATNQRKLVDFNKLKIINRIDDPSLDDASFNVAKWVIFTKLSDHSFTLFELQTNNTDKCRLRIQKSKKKEGENDVEFIFADDSAMLFDIFKHYALSYLNDKVYNYSFQLPNSSVGSKQLQQIAWKAALENCRDLDESVGDFIENIWNEAIGDLEEMLEFDFDNFAEFPVDQINKAECVLRKQKDALTEGDCIEDFSDEFYSILPMKDSYKKSLKEKQVLFQRFELCQVLRDMVTISEATNWNLRSATEAKYRSIGAYIKKVDENQNDCSHVKDLIFSSYSEDSNNKVKVLNIYQVIRSNESSKFNNELPNSRLLFHGTKARNIVGVLSRGLLLPNYTVNEIGVTRSDIGMLGNGIYFSDCINTSLKYTDLSKLRNTRMVGVCEVALGNCKDYYDYDFSLTEPPKNYHSTHGVKKSSEKESKFMDDEYVIYNVTQQKLKYIVELQYEYDGKVLPTRVFPNQAIQDKNITDESYEITKNEIDRLEQGNKLVDKNDFGLMSGAGNAIPLKSIHVRVQLLDMISKVHIFQEYENEESYPIEAKYIFPLDDNAAVCGFEAFINDKHVIGICKEKEEAHREYKEAIEKGHGAYLMDQETPELFKVNIGNLPSNCKCIIKITYVAELSVENENIVFRLPNYIAPWQSIKLKNEQIQDKLISKCFESLTETKQISLQISIQMPFNIRSIHSPTHSIHIKRTQCHAVVELNKNQSLKETFILNVSMSAIHVPRMLVEDNDSCLHERACMLSFYPEFETNIIENPYIVFLLDSSNSMSKDSFKYAKKLIQLMLRKLPQKCFFNIVSFGSYVNELFPFSLKNEQHNLQKAVDFVNKVRPQSGNTDLLNAIQPYLLINHNDIVNFVLISDGHINEPEGLISTLKKSNLKNRFFNCAVGSNSNKHLLKMIAYTTNGSFDQFDSQFQSKWKDKVDDIMDKLCQPTAIGNINVEWQTHNKSIDNIKINNNYEISLQAPSKIHSLFNGRRQVVYGFVSNCLLATLKANLDDQEVSTVVSCPQLMITKGTVIHKLTAKALIDDWQYGLLCDDQFKNEIIKNKLKDKIIELSKSYSITSEYTSFIAIEERDEKEKNKKYSKNESTTPSIESLLEKDVDASSIDILSYMCYSEDDEAKGNNFEQMLNQIYNSYGDLKDDDKYELSLLIEQYSNQINKAYPIKSPIRLKFNHLLLKELDRRSLYNEALKLGKEILDKITCLDEEVADESCAIVDEFRNYIDKRSIINETIKFPPGLNCETMSYNELVILTEQIVGIPSNDFQLVYKDKNIYVCLDDNFKLNNDIIYNLRIYIKYQTNRLTEYKESKLHRESELKYNEKLNRRNNLKFWTDRSDQTVKKTSLAYLDSEPVRMIKMAIEDECSYFRYVPSTGSSAPRFYAEDFKMYQTEVCRKDFIQVKAYEEELPISTPEKIIIDKNETNVFLPWNELKQSLNGKSKILIGSNKFKGIALKCGSAENSDEFDKLIQDLTDSYLDYKKINDVLENCGISSLGVEPSFEIKKMIFYLFVCYLLAVGVNIDFKNRSISGIEDLETLMMEIKQQISVKIEEYIDYIKKIQIKHCLACSMLEITRNWNIFITKWFNNEIKEFF